MEEFEELMDFNNQQQAASNHYNIERFMRPAMQSLSQQSILYQAYRSTSDALSVVNVVTGGYYGNRAASTYDHLDFIGSNAGSDYLKNIGMHTEVSTSSVMTASSKKDKIDALRQIYQAGLESMKTSDNLASIYLLKDKGANAVSTKAHEVSRKIDSQIVSYTNLCKDADMNKLLTQKHLTNADISTLNKMVNANRTLSAKDKETFKSLIADKQNVTEFLSTGTIYGGTGNKDFGRQMRGKSIIIRNFVGNDLYYTTDLLMQGIKVSKIAVKNVYGLGASTLYHGGNLANESFTFGAKIIENATEKVTGNTATHRVSKYSEKMFEKRKQKHNKLKERERAKKRGKFSYKDYKDKESLATIEERKKRYKNKADKFESQLEKAKASGDLETARKLERKQRKHRKKETKWNKKGIRFQKNKIKKIYKKKNFHLPKPSKKEIKKAIIDLGKKVISAIGAKGIAIICGVILLFALIIFAGPIMISAIGGIIGGESQNEQDTLQASMNYTIEQTQVAMELYSVLSEYGLNDYMIAAAVGNMMQECSLNPASGEMGGAGGLGLIQISVTNSTYSKFAGVFPSLKNDATAQMKWILSNYVTPSGNILGPYILANQDHITNVKDATDWWYMKVEGNSVPCDHPSRNRVMKNQYYPDGILLHEIDRYQHANNFAVIFSLANGMEYTGQGVSVINFAMQFIGNPYVWGGTSLTNGADCSGFTQSVYRNFGISLPRTAQEQCDSGIGIEIVNPSVDNMQPGDLIFYGSSATNVGHVAIYIGNGQIVHASNSQPYPKGGIKVSSNYNYRKIIKVKRYVY